MEFLDVVRRRQTTNGPVSGRPVSLEHQHRLVEAAGMAPSHFNSQPWRFVLIDDPDRVREIADISAESMRHVFRAGEFFTRYRKFFRFSDSEMDERRDGILFDQLPRALRPFRRLVFTDTATKVMNRLGVPDTLADANRELVNGAPLVIAALLDKEEYRPGELSGFYSVFGLGAAMENLWLTTTELGMGIQFISFPMEVPDQWARLVDLLAVPPELELMALYRVGYVDEQAERPPIDWSSRHRKRRSDYVFRNSCTEPEPDESGDAEPEVAPDPLRSPDMSEPVVE